MTDFDKKLDEIAEKAFMTCHSAFVNREHDRRVIKRAMLAAIELYAQRERSLKALQAGYPPEDASAQDWGIYEIFRAMQAAQLKEIKENANAVHK